MIEAVYKIRDKNTGLFSKGGSWPRFSKKGKIWAGKGPLNSHLAYLDNYYDSSNRGAINFYNNCEIVEFGIGVESNVYSFQYWNARRKEERFDKDQKRHKKALENNMYFTEESIKRTEQTLIKQKQELEKLKEQLNEQYS